MRALIALCLLATPALADVAGTATLIDGDNLEITANACASMGSTRRSPVEEFVYHLQGKASASASTTSLSGV